ncbi:MAG: hypothetical protein IT545_02295 [Rhodobacteraceae bacterium]|nr:hypothetical protein [Paracoccaceae bacterium]
MALPPAALLLLLAVLAAGCDRTVAGGGDGPAAPAAVVAGAGDLRPRPRPAAALALEPAGSPAAAAAGPGAATAAAGGGRAVGTAVVSLGPPAAPGLWLATPLVGAPGRGRVVLAATGAAVAVELRPAPAGASVLSLAAFRLLGLPLTALAEVEVFAF